MHSRLCAVAVAAAATTPALAGSFQVIGADVQLWPKAISADGSVLVGTGLTPSQTERWPMRWTSSGLSYIGTIDASVKTGAPTAISPDGSIIAGYMQDAADVRQGFRWTASGGYEMLGTVWSVDGVSADGTVVGATNFGTATNAYRYTSSMQPITGFAGQRATYNCTGISSDGSTVIGQDQMVEGYFWTAAGGVQNISAANAVPRSVSHNGAVITGDAGGALFRYSMARGYETLGSPSGTHSEAYVAGASSDGSIIVGNAIVPMKPELGAAPFYWTESGGFASLDDVLEANDIQLGTYVILNITGISGDGRTIFGDGLENGVQPSAWVAVVPEPGGLGLMAIGVAAAMRRRRA